MAPTIFVMRSCISRVRHCRMPALLRAMGERPLLNRQSLTLLNRLLTLCAERAAKRAAKSAAKAAKAAFTDGIDSWMRRLRNIDIDADANDEDDNDAVADEHETSWMRRLRFEDGSDGAGGAGGSGLVA